MSEETEAARAAAGETVRATLVLLARGHAALEAGLEVGLSPMETARRAVIVVPTDEQADGSPLYVAVGEEEELVRGTLEGARRGITVNLKLVPSAEGVRPSLPPGEARSSLPPPRAVPAPSDKPEEGT